MVLVDSSIWIAVERGAVDLFALVPGEETVVATCPAIIHEVLRGTQSPKQHQLALELLMTTELLDSPTPLERFLEAATIYRQCRFAGLTPSIGDCLVTACAIANRVPLLHQDTDFDAIAGVTTLKVFTRS